MIRCTRIYTKKKLSPKYKFLLFSADIYVSSLVLRRCWAAYSLLCLFDFVCVMKSRTTEIGIKLSRQGFSGYSCALKAWAFALRWFGTDWRDSFWSHLFASPPILISEWKITKIHMRNAYNLALCFHISNCFYLSFVIM